MFNALVVEKDEDGKTSAAVQQISEADLPQAEVTVAVEYSTVNYKDGLCIGPGGGLVRNYPHVPGIDFAGTVETSSDPRYSPGDKVVLTGWRVGEAHWGGYSQKARVRADWLVPLPQGLSTRAAMAVGTAGFTAMLAVMALEDHGLTPGHGEVLVTGAAGAWDRSQWRSLPHWGTRWRLSPDGPKPRITCADLARPALCRARNWPKPSSAHWNPRHGQAVSMLWVVPCWHGCWGR